MPNLAITELESIRTRLWAYGCMQQSGVSTPSALEKKFARSQEIEWLVPSNMWRRYLKGTMRPFKSRAPRPDAPFVDRAEVLWPFTAEVFYTPIWYLLEDRSFTTQDVLDSALALPELYQQYFISDFSGIRIPGLTLKEVDFEMAFVISSTVSLWSLGALVVLMRRAELAGQIAVFRSSLTAILWMIPKLAEMVGGNRRYLYQRLRRLIVSNFLPKFVIAKNEGRPLRLVDQTYFHWFEVHRSLFLKQKELPYAHPSILKSADDWYEFARKTTIRRYGERPNVNERPNLLSHAAMMSHRQGTGH